MSIGTAVKNSATLGGDASGADHCQRTIGNCAKISAGNQRLVCAITIGWGRPRGMAVDRDLPRLGRAAMPSDLKDIEHATEARREVSREIVSNAGRTCQRDR